MDDPVAAVLDTNALLDVHLFVDPGATRLHQALAGGSLHWHATRDMLAELAAVLARPLGPRWDAQRERLLADTSWARPTKLWPLPPQPTSAAHGTPRCADPSDQKFIDLALHIGARWLVTRDRALLALRRKAAHHGVIILAPRDWPGL